MQISFTPTHTFRQSVYCGLVGVVPDIDLTSLSYIDVHLPAASWPVSQDHVCRKEPEKWPFGLGYKSAM